jgi:cytochrome c-type protein NapB
MRACCLTLVALVLVLVTSCQRSAPPRPTQLTPSAVRAERRAYNGAPPVIPHGALGPSCAVCHAETARDVPGIGFAPPNPHLKTHGMSDAARCQQCHVFQSTKEVFVVNDFRPLLQDPRPGERLYAHAPPVIPHGLFLREDCAACHAGAASRPEVRCSHPERVNCLQCHARGK